MSFDNNDLKLNSLYLSCKNTLFETDNNIDEQTLEELDLALSSIEEDIFKLEKLKLKLGQLKDYNTYKLQGASKEKLASIKSDDINYLNKVDALYKNNMDKRDYMFGYPCNMEKDSYLLSYLRFLESKLYLMNNCGDPYERGNYGMDSKEIEREIIRLYANSFGLDEGEYWGYVTTGGTESNFWAIREGFNKFPDGRLYFSESTHYSVEKFVNNSRMGMVYPYTIVKSSNSGAISVDSLTQSIAADHKKWGYKPVILVLTWGTTKEGAIDPIKEITDYLKNNNIEYYCHIDGALYGGIPQNQKNAPSVENLKALNVDSISISLHKFLGAARANGILISLGRNKRKQIDYIGQEDSTLLGSRDFPPFSTLQRVREFMFLKDQNHYIKNVEYFKNLLNRNNISYTTFDDQKSNIFIIDKPSDKICKKYQLATFWDNGKEKVHIIIFPFHQKEFIDSLCYDIKNQ